MSECTERFNQDGAEIKGFSASCENCGSKSVAVEYRFNYYSGMTGWDQSLAIVCKFCGQRAELDL